MLALWVAIGVAGMLILVALGVVARRTADEVTPTVRAFEEFRAALRPAVAAAAQERRVALSRNSHKRQCRVLALHPLGGRGARTFEQTSFPVQTAGASVARCTRRA